MSFPSFHSNKKFTRIASLFLIYSTAFFLFCVLHWLNLEFGQTTIDQLIFHLSYNEDLANGTDQEIIESFLIWSVLTPMLLAALAVFLDITVSRYWNRRIETKRRLPSASNPDHALNKLNSRVWHLKAPLLLGVGVFLFLYQESVFSYILPQQSGHDFFAEHYVPPQSIKLEQQKTKNLVLIYVESFEATYGDKKVFKKDLLSPLKNLHGVSFNDFQQVPGTGWTMAGTVASQCGIPLKSVLLSAAHEGWDEGDINNDTGEKLDTFLPNATCLGDILNAHGYQNVYLGGVSANFAGTRAFFKTHHYDEILGRDEWAARGIIPEYDEDGWGLRDDKLFEQAKSKLKALHASGKKFNLTVFTIDTHGPTGFISKTCAKAGVETFDGIVQCTARQVADFITFMKQNGYLKDTNVVITGDHIAMRNPLTGDLEKSSSRRIFNLFISDSPPVKTRETIVHFDLFPTILDFIGLRVDGNQLGLGYSGFINDKTVLPEKRIDEMMAELPKNSVAYWQLWDKD